MAKVIEFKIKEYNRIKAIVPQIDLTILNVSEESISSNIKLYNEIVSRLFQEHNYKRDDINVKGINNIIVVDEPYTDLSNIFKEITTISSSTYGGNEYRIGNGKQNIYFCPEIETRSDIDDLIVYLDYAYKDLNYTIYTTLEYTVEEKMLDNLSSLAYMTYNNI